MRKKIVSALLCVTMAASLVVGCGSKSDQTVEAAKAETSLYTGLCGAKTSHRQKLSRKQSKSTKKILVLK